MIAAKRWLQYVKGFTTNAVVDTASLSNLGNIAPLPPPFDTAGAGIWFSPPCQMPLGVGIGAVTHGERLHVTVRYRHAQFDRDAARTLLAVPDDFAVEAVHGEQTPEGKIVSLSRDSPAKQERNSLKREN